MGKRHNTLDYKYFHKTKYIKTLEKEFGIKKFKIEYPEQFNIMYDVFKTLILVNNILFADSNKSKQDKITDIIIELEKCIYGELDNDSNKYKYSVRQINGLFDKHTRYLFKKFIEWYEYLDSISEFEPIKEQIEFEMNRLDEKNFDFIEEDNISYKKNKDNTYCIFLSKFYEYSCDYNFLNEYLDLYYINNVEDISREDLQVEICYIYNLIACANNGIANYIFERKIEYDFENFSPYAYIENYFKYLNIELKENTSDNSLMNFFNEVNKILVYFKFNNKILKEKLDTKKIYENYDLYYFIANINMIIDEDITFDTKNPMLMKIVDDLKQVYQLIKAERYMDAYEISKSIIKRNKELYIRIS